MQNQMGNNMMMNQQFQPIILNFKQQKQNQDNSIVQIDSQVSINQLDKSVEVSEKINNARIFFQQLKNQQAMEIIQGLSAEKKIEYMSNSMNPQEVENPQNETRHEMNNN